MYISWSEDIQSLNKKKFVSNLLFVYLLQNNKNGNIL